MCGRLITAVASDCYRGRGGGGVGGEIHTTFQRQATKHFNHRLKCLQLSKVSAVVFSRMIRAPLYSCGHHGGWLEVSFWLRLLSIAISNMNQFNANVLLAILKESIKC